MSVAAQTWSRTNLRQFAFTTDVVLRENIDHVFSHSPTLAIMASRTLGDFGGTKLAGMGKDVQEGGHAVVIRVRLGAHAGAKRGVSDFDTHNVSPDDNTRFAEANWRFYTHGLAVSTHDLRVNRGDAAMADFLEDQTMSVMLALGDMVGSDIHSTSAAANAMTPLATLIGNGTAQGLATTSYANYFSRGLSTRGTAAASVSYTSGSFAAQGLSDMRRLRNNASEGMIGPEVVVTQHDTVERYEGVLQPLERFQGAVQVADGSFPSLAFHAMPVLGDPKCASGYLYMLRVSDNDGVKLRILEGADFQFGEWKPSSNQNVMVRPLEATMALTIGNRLYGNNKMHTISD